MVVLYKVKLKMKSLIFVFQRLIYDDFRSVLFMHVAVSCFTTLIEFYFSD